MLKARRSRFPGEFGIARTTGYKILERYKACGLDGLYDRSQAPYRQAKKPPFQVERAILGLTREFQDRIVRVTRCERICLGSRKINLGVALAVQRVGIPEVNDQVRESAS